MGYKVVIICNVATEADALEVIGRVAGYSGALVVKAEIEKIDEE